MRAALADDFDTPKVLACLLDMIRLTNCCFDKSDFSSVVIFSIAKYITSVLRTFGLVDNLDEIGFPLEASKHELNGKSREQLIAPYLDALTSFRESVRIAAMSGDSKAVLDAADNLRDNVLPDLGVRMEDKGIGKDALTIWKLDDPDILKQEKVQREQMKMTKQIVKEEKERKEREKLERSKISPSIMFLKDTHLYSAFDDNGFPMKDVNGEPLSKGLLKKLTKEYNKQKVLHDQYKSVYITST